MKKIKQPIIKSSGFILRPFKLSDAKSVTENANDLEIARNVGPSMPYPYTIGCGEYWVKLQSNIRRRKNRDDFSFAIVVDGKSVGSISLMKLEYGYKCEIGYWLGRNFWGHGIMSEAVRLVSKFGFETFKLERIYAGVAYWNKGSTKVLEKQGYKLEGVQQKDFKDRDGKFKKSFLYAKVK